MSEGSPDGALDETNLIARCRGCHQLEHYAGQRCAAKTTGPLPLSTDAAVYATHFNPVGLPHFRESRRLVLPDQALSFLKSSTD
jgi:hypothetical protein